MQTVKSFIYKYYSENTEILLSHYAGLRNSRLLEEYCQFYNVKQEEVYSPKKGEFFEFISKAVPLEYIQKNAYFYKSNFYVDDRVLIPRSETEILVEDSISYIEKHYKNKYRVAEIGTGSFIIGLTILMEVNKPLFFIGGDLSSEALEVSRLNLFKLKSKIHPESYIELIKSDKLLSIEGEYDFIVSNPPYIKSQKDLSGVHFQTDKYEPHMALYLEDEIFDSWFEDLFQSASEKLTESGAFFMEGHEDSLLHLKEIALKYFNNVEIKKDYTQRDRFLYGFK
ncbi:MAG: release factor glutamine methyltransferase [Bacteriovoracaceae bacterium]|jgi:release factor glutamine methyltransferase